ncbi:hypothetical protein FB451DRAFT_1227027 [Mycena latifolia]|nr:hypothetical protein FB451DRAFT_1227027 [Mycena latifolia]
MSSSAPHRKHSILSLLNPTLPADEPRNAQQQTNIGAGPTLNERVYRSHAANRMHSDDRVFSRARDELEGSSSQNHSSEALNTRTRYSPPPDFSAAPMHPEPPTGFQPYPGARGRLSQISQKRPLSDVQDAEERPNSKRGDNSRRESVAAAPTQRSKKREEATKWTTLNEGAPGTMYTIIPNTGSKHEAPCRVTSDAFAANTTRLVELQVFRCMYKDYKPKSDIFPRCLPCTNHLDRDACRFQHIRAFLLDDNKKITGFYFPNHGVGETAPIVLPSAWNIPLERSHIHETKKAIAHTFTSVLRMELERITSDSVVYMPGHHKATCDQCDASIFCSSWMCSLCGRSFCAECFEKVKIFTASPPRVPAQDLARFWWFSACFKNRSQHGAEDFVLVSRLSTTEVIIAVRDMEQLLLDEPAAAFAPGSPGSDTVFSGNGADSIADGSSPDIPVHTIRQFTEAELTENIFRSIWEKEEPLLVTGVGRRLKVDWSPAYFTTKYGSDPCAVFDWQKVNHCAWMPMAKLLGNFGSYEGRETCWKLMSWRPPREFYADLAQAAPMPNYVRQNGVRNITSHLPDTPGGPDLAPNGPNLSIVHASSEVANRNGSTRLHIDRADVLNIMTFASCSPDGQEGHAAWDIFRAQDSGKIQQFLRRKFKITAHLILTDQENQAYLDDEARRELWRDYGVKSFRVYQRACDAVFVPAGCAYQVCNLSDCITATIAFASPEHIERCEMLARELALRFRMESRKTPVFPVRTILWFAWLSCCIQEKALVPS